MEEYKNVQTKSEETQNISIRDIIDFVWHLRWWIVGCGLLALFLGFFYVRMQTPVFSRTSWIMLNRDDGSTGSGELTMLSQLTGTRVRKKIDNEIFILRSPTLMSKVVEELNLNSRYYSYNLPAGDQKLRIFRWIFPKKLVEFYKDSPIEMVVIGDHLLPSSMLPQYIRMEIKADDEGDGFIVRKLVMNKSKFSIKGKFNFGDTLSVGHMRLCINTTELGKVEGDRRYLCTWTTPFRAAEKFLSNFTAEVQGDKRSNIYINNLCDVVMLTLEDNKAQRASDILNSLVIACNEDSKDYNNITSINTIKFIDERLKDISRELVDAESDVKEYQSRHSVVDFDSQAGASVTADMSYKNQLTEVKVQKRILSMIEDYLREDNTGEYRVIPANIGVSDAGLNNIIGRYNELVSERNRMIANSSATNPRVLSMTPSIEDGIKSIKLSVTQLLSAYSIREKELEKTLEQSQSRMSSMPAQQYAIQQLSRRVDIIEPLYQMLQQKREEAQIAMYVQSDNFRVIEAAFGSAIPIKPSPMRIYLIALILGCCMPPLIVWLRNVLRTKVENKKDLEDNVDAPIIATLLHNSGEADRLLERQDRDAFAEAFRMLRSNLRYLPETKVVQVTSSFPGEGKSYISSNLAVSLSHLEKKVLLVGMDFRKPILRKFFPKVKYDNQRNVISYLLGNTDDLAGLPHKSGVDANLDIVFSGPVPPNPTELLSLAKVKDFVDYYRKKYDYIVIDTTPFLPVPDSMLVNQYVDATLYVVRAGSTDLKVLKEIQN
jgi:tyrosine-protein kinase Etk/Wzc